MAEILRLSRLPAADTESLADRVARRLRQVIASGELASGARVSERALAASLGVSVAPVRDALHRLEAEGLVVTRPRRGTYIADFGPERLEEMGRIRVALEAVAAGLAARRATAADIAALRARLAEMRDATREGALDALAEANEAFHALIHAIAGNAFLDASLRALRGYERVGRHRTLSVPGEGGRALREHAALLSAIRRQDPEAAEARMRAHGLRSLEQAARGANPAETRRTA